MEIRLRTLLASISQRVDLPLDEIWELVDAGELVVGFESLCDILFEHDVDLSASEITEIEGLGRLSESSRNSWRLLAGLDVEELNPRAEQRRSVSGYASTVLPADEFLRSRASELCPRVECGEIRAVLADLYGEIPNTVEIARFVQIIAPDTPQGVAIEAAQLVRVDAGSVASLLTPWLRKDR